MSNEHQDQNLELVLFLRALREFSDSCEAPELTPSCPFAVEVTPGQRGCGEECMDILGRHQAPGPVEERTMAEGITVTRVRRPRARRPSSTGPVAFDARQLFLEEKSSGPPTRWRLGSILMALEEGIGEVPPADPDAARERRDYLRTLLTVAENRGLEVEGHLLPFLRNRIVPAIVSACVSNTLAHESPNAELVNRWLEKIAEESQVDPSELIEDDLGQGLAKAMSVVESWAEHAPVEDLFGWNAADAFPEPGTGTQSPTEHDEAKRLDGQWMFDRFTTTYLDRWASESMRREWRYIHGQSAPPCSPTEMRGREVGEAELAAAMADRMSRDRGRRLRVIHAMEAAYFIPPAIAFLQQGRRLEARALFEAVLHRDPENADANNNLGFCLLPDDPARALVHFDMAASARNGPPEVVCVNRMLALARLGRLTSMLEAASSLLTQAELTSTEPVEVKLDERSGTVLWKIDSVLGQGHPELLNTSDFTNYARAIVEFTRR